MDTVVRVTRSLRRRLNSVDTEISGRSTPISELDVLREESITPTRRYKKILNNNNNDSVEKTPSTRSTRGGSINESIASPAVGTPLRKTRRNSLSEVNTLIENLGSTKKNLHKIFVPDIVEEKEQLNEMNIDYKPEKTKKKKLMVKISKLKRKNENESISNKEEPGTKYVSEERVEEGSNETQNSVPQQNETSPLSISFKTNMLPNEENEEKESSANNQNSSYASLNNSSKELEKRNKTSKIPKDGIMKSQLKDSAENFNNEQAESFKISKSSTVLKQSNREKNINEGFGKLFDSSYSKQKDKSQNYQNLSHLSNKIEVEVISDNEQVPASQPVKTRYDKFERQSLVDKNNLEKKIDDTKENDLSDYSNKSNDPNYVSIQKFSNKNISNNDVEKNITAEKIVRDATLDSSINSVNFDEHDDEELSNIELHQIAENNEIEVDNFYNQDRKVNELSEYSNKNNNLSNVSIQELSTKNISSNDVGKNVTEDKIVRDATLESSIKSGHFDKHDDEELSNIELHQITESNETEVKQKSVTFNDSESGKEMNKFRKTPMVNKNKSPNLLSEKYFYEGYESPTKLNTLKNCTTNTIEEASQHLIQNEKTPKIIINDTSNKMAKKTVIASSTPLHTGIHINHSKQEGGNMLSGNSPKESNKIDKFSKSWIPSVRCSTGDKIDTFGLSMQEDIQCIKNLQPITTNLTKSGSKSKNFECEDDEENSEGRESVNEFIDNEAEEANIDDDSLDEEERQYLQDHEIIEKGESLGSEDTIQSNSENSEKDESFIVSDNDEENDIEESSTKSSSKSESEQYCIVKVDYSHNNNETLKTNKKNENNTPKIEKSVQNPNLPRCDAEKIIETKKSENNNVSCSDNEENESSSNSDALEANDSITDEENDFELFNSHTSKFQKSQLNLKDSQITNKSKNELENFDTSDKRLNNSSTSTKFQSENRNSGASVLNESKSKQMGNLSRSFRTDIVSNSSISEGNIFQKRRLSKSSKEDLALDFEVTKFIDQSSSEEEREEKLSKSQNKFVVCEESDDKTPKKRRSEIKTFKDVEENENDTKLCELVEINYQTQTESPAPVNYNEKENEKDKKVSKTRSLKALDEITSTSFSFICGNNSCEKRKLDLHSSYTEGINPESISNNQLSLKTSTKSNRSSLSKERKEISPVNSPKNKNWTENLKNDIDTTTNIGTHSENYSNLRNNASNNNENEEIENPKSINVVHILKRCNEILNAANEAKLRDKLKRKNEIIKVTDSAMSKKNKKDSEEIGSAENVKNRKALSKALQHAETILLNGKSNKNDCRTGKKQTKFLPAEILEEISNKKNEPLIEAKSKYKSMDNVMQSNLVSTASGLFNEEPITPKRKQIYKIELPTGTVFEEPISPILPKQKSGFIESPVTPLGFKVRRILSAGQKEIPELNPNKKVKRKLLKEPVNVLPKRVWTSAGEFTEEIYKPVNNNNENVPTKFYAVPLKLKKPRTGQVSYGTINEKAIQFKQTALSSTNTCRETSKQLLQRKERQKFYNK